MPKLSRRLETIATLVPFGARVCDIGTDHGYLAIELIKTERADSVIATDIGEKPLLNAKKNIEKFGITDISLRLCDGLSGIEKGEADTVIIAGMGGEVIAGILDKGCNITKDLNITLILQPTTSPDFLRKFLCENGYKIITEIPVFENQKCYSVMKVSYTANPFTPSSGYCFAGEVKPDSEDGNIYLKKQQKRCFECVTALEKCEKQTEEYFSFKSALEYINQLLTEN